MPRGSALSPRGRGTAAGLRGSRRALARVKPGQAGQRLVHGKQGVGRRDELGAEPAAAGVQEAGEPVGEGAAAAEPAAVQLALETAARAGEGLGESGAVSADRGAVARASAWKHPLLTAPGAGSPGPHRAV